MNGLPKDTDLTFLIGRQLVQVAVGAFQIQLHFDANVSVSIESDSELDGALAPVGVEAARRLLGLIGEVVTDARSIAERHLGITFSNGATLTVLENDEPFESYSITSPDGTWIV
jgi:Family of unknown function (DUF6188)